MTKYESLIEVLKENLNNDEETKLKIKGVKDFGLEEFKVRLGERYELGDIQEDLTLYLGSYGNITQEKDIKIGNFDTRIKYYYKQDNHQDIKLKINNSEYTIGFYLPEENRVIIGIAYFISLDLFDFLSVLNEISKLKIIKKDMSELKKQKFIANLKGIKDRTISNLKTQIERDNRDLKEYISNIDLKNRNVRENILMLNTMEKSKEDYFEKVVKQMEEIKNLKMVTDLTYNEEGFIFLLNNIKIKFNGTDFPIGNFEIKVKINGEYTFKNLTPLIFKDNERGREHIFHHPHIFGNDTTTICMGGAKAKLLNDYIQELNLIGIAQLINLFLKSYTHDDCYNCIHNFDERNIKSVEGKRFMYFEYEKSGEFYCSDISREEGINPIDEYTENSGEDEENYEDEYDGENEDE